MCPTYYSHENSWGTPLHSSWLCPPAPLHPLPSLTSQLNHSCVSYDGLIAANHHCQVQVSLAWEYMVFNRQYCPFTRTKFHNLAQASCQLSHPLTDSWPNSWNCREKLRTLWEPLCFLSLQEKHPGAHNNGAPRLSVFTILVPQGSVLSQFWCPLALYFHNTGAPWLCIFKILVPPGFVFSKYLPLGLLVLTVLTVPQSSLSPTQMLEGERVAIWSGEFLHLWAARAGICQNMSYIKPRALLGHDTDWLMWDLLMI